MPMQRCSARHRAHNAHTVLYTQPTFPHHQVIFAPSMPWLQQGTRVQDRPMAIWLMTVLPESLVGAIDLTIQYQSDILLTILLVFSTIYILLIGEVRTYTRLMYRSSPSHRRRV